MRKTALGALAATLGLAGAALTGCSTDSGTDAITLTIWHNTQDPAATLETYAAYEEHSGNTVELVPISSDGFEDAVFTKWATGERPDLLEFHAMASYIDKLNPRENLQDLSEMDFVGASGTLYEVGGRGGDGNVYAAITNFPEVWGLYYNKAILADLGLEPASTYEDLAGQCAELSAAGITTLAESGASVWPPAAIPLTLASSAADAGWAARITANETTVDADDSPILRGLSDYRALIDAGCMNDDITSATFEDSVAAVFAGEAAYQAIHSNIAPVYLDAAGGDAELLGQTVGFTSLGADEVTAMINPGVIGTYLAPKTGDEARERAVREFIEFVTGEHYATYIESSGTFPVLDGTPAPSSATPLAVEIKAAYDAGPTVAMIVGNVPGGMSGIFPLLSELIVGQKSPGEVSAALQTQLADAAKAQGLEGW